MASIFTRDTSYFHCDSLNYELQFIESQWKHAVSRMNFQTGSGVCNSQPSYNMKIFVHPAKDSDLRRRSFASTTGARSWVYRSESNLRQRLDYREVLFKLYIYTLWEKKVLNRTFWFSQENHLEPLMLLEPFSLQWFSWEDNFRTFILRVYITNHACIQIGSLW